MTDDQDRADEGSTWTLRSERVLLPDGAGGLRVAPAQVVVQGHRIASVRPAHEPASSPVVDLGSDLLAPAWVNAHTHIAMTAMRGLSSAQSMSGNVVEDLFYRFERHLQPGDVRAFARIGALECVLSGTGVVWDHYYHAEEVAEALVDVGLAGVVAPTLQDRDGPGAGHTEAAWRAVEALDSDAWRARGIVPAYGPHATDTTSDALWARLAAEAAARPLPIHVHLAQSAEEYRRSVADTGLGPAGRLVQLGALDWDVPVLGVHAMWIPGRERRLLSRERFVLGHCPASQLQFSFPARASTWWAEGFSVAVGTDCAASNDGMDPQRELALVAGGPRWAVAHSAAARALEDDGPGAVEAVEQERARAWAAEPDLAHLIASISSIPGRLHPGMPSGEIAPGAHAHLAVWSAEDPHLWPLADPLRALAFSHLAPALRGLVVQGQWTIPLDGRAAFVADARWREARREARARLDALLQRAGVPAPGAADPGASPLA